MYEIETVHVPVPDRNHKANSYTKVQIHKPYIAAGDDYYIQLRMTVGYVQIHQTCLLL